MKRSYWVILSFFILFATAPWYFMKQDLSSIAGFPPWAFTSFILTIIYAVVLFLMLNYSWKTPNNNEGKNE